MNYHRDDSMRAGETVESSIHETISNDLTDVKSKLFSNHYSGAELACYDNTTDPNKRGLRYNRFVANITGSHDIRFILLLFYYMGINYLFGIDSE